MSPQQALGPFKLLRVLGRGGMGTVYEAKDTKSGDIVAVKALSPAYSFDEHFRNRFEAEIDALMQLDHPNIVRLLSYGQDDGNLFFAMELVKGNSLFVEQKHGHVFSFSQVIDIALQICSGLRHAHDRGIIHRDLKPGNLMLDVNNLVKITDFGIAKSFGASHITSEGSVVGTMDFMAPEQARGRVATARSDLFSLGAVMYAMLTGKAPFLRESVDETFDNLLSAKPPPRLSKLVPGLPIELSKFVHRLLEKDPEKRFGTARAAENQLRYIVETIRETPQAETQVVSATDSLPTKPEESADDDSTFVFEKSKKPAPSSPARDTAKYPGRTEMSDQSDPDLTVETDARQEIRSVIKPTPDYFAKVTPQLREKRQKQQDTDDSAPPGRIWPLLMALLVVVALILFGIYSVFKRPTAEELLAEINAEKYTPHRVEPQLDAFLRYYPDHAEFERIQRLRRYAEAISFRNKLRGQSLFSQQTLGPIQRMFLNVTDLESTEAPIAFEKIDAFILQFENDSMLTEEEEKAIESAKIYLEQLAVQAEQQKKEYANHIRSVIEQARETAKNSKSEALALLQSLKTTFGDQPWASELMDEVDLEIDQIDQ